MLRRAEVEKSDKYCTEKFPYLLEQRQGVGKLPEHVQGRLKCERVGDGPAALAAASVEESVEKQGVEALGTLSRPRSEGDIGE